MSEIKAGSDELQTNAPMSEMLTAEEIQEYFNELEQDD
jgi:hypothetical protein